MADAVIVEYKDGRTYEVESAAIARKAHPEATIVRFAATQEPYKEGAKASAPPNPPVTYTAGGEIAPHVDESTGVAVTKPTEATKDKA